MHEHLEVMDKTKHYYSNRIRTEIYDLTTDKIRDIGSHFACLQLTIMHQKIGKQLMTTKLVD